MGAASLRVGVLGGTFDPIHGGHVDLALGCARALHLDQVRLVTNRAAPHKPPAEAQGVHRHAMTALATAGKPALVADPRELSREGPSYTVQTLEDLADQFPGAQLFFLAGADSLRDLPSWHRWQDVLALATFVAVRRAGLDPQPFTSALAPDARARVRVVDHEPPPWTATAVRQALRAGQAPAGALDPLVLEYVLKHDLYRSGTAPPAPARSTE